MEQLMKQMEIVKSDVGMRWEMVKLSDVCDVLGGYAFKSENFKNEGIPLLRISNIFDGEVSFKEDCVCVEDSNLLSLQRFKVIKGDILLALSGATTGKFGVYKLNDFSFLNQRVGLIRATDKTDPKYLLYYLNILKSQIEQIAQGAAQPNISTNEIGNLQIPLPPLPIQKRIAEILDAADALKRKDQELLKKYDELAQAIFIDMFGDPVKNEKGWEVKKLGELFSSPVKCGPFGSALKKEEYVKDGIPVWIMDNIQDYNFNENGCLYINEDKYLDLTSYSALKGDIIISRAGTVGKMCVVDSEFKKSIISTNLIKISLDEKVLNPYFFVKLMNYFGKKIGRLRTGSENGFTHMNTGVLAGLEFPLPSITKQNEYINVLKNINYQIQFLGTKPESLFQTLIQKAFKGELVK